MSKLSELVDIIAGKPTHYEGISEIQIRHACEIAVSTLEKIFSDHPDQIVDAIVEEAMKTGHEVMHGGSSRRTWGSSDEVFLQTLGDVLTPLRDRHSVHLEFGTYITWPDDVVEQYIDSQQIGDAIRLDMNPEYPIDIAASVTALPFADESIDRIFSNSLLEHVLYPHEAIREAFRVLRPGGVFYNVVPFNFIEHRVPADYLRYTGQFFEHVMADIGFESVTTDTKSCSGVYFTAHRLLKGGVALGPNTAATAHLVSLILLGLLRPADRLFSAEGASLYADTRVVAVKPGEYQARTSAPDRTLPFIERYRECLICPKTGLPVHKQGDFLVSLDGSERYEIVNGVPQLFVMHGFGSSFLKKPSSREVLAEYSKEPRDA